MKCPKCKTKINKVGEAKYRNGDKQDIYYCGNCLQRIYITEK